MSLTKERVLSIENITMDLLKEAYGGEEVVIPPIDLDKVTAYDSLKVMAGDFKDPDISGAYDRRERVIYVRKKDPIVRKVFTVAHELGHYHLHKDKINEIFYRQDMDNLEESDEKNQEQEANWFAASLLMPKDIFLRFWMIFKDIHVLAARFGVSSQAAYYRLKNLGMI